MPLIQLDYREPFNSLQVNNEIYHYDEELDNIESLIMDICDYINGKDGINFEVSGFGLEWPVDIRTDLATIIPQIVEAIIALEEGSDFSIQFYEQGIERELCFFLKGIDVMVVCKKLGGEKCSEVVERVNKIELEQSLKKNIKSFQHIASILCPTITKNRIYQEWINNRQPGTLITL